MMSRKLIVERDVETRMRDGVALRADVYRPDAPETCPVLLQRTPYGKGFANPALALVAAERGYAVVIQDTRGRWASDGDGYPFVHEFEDGYDTVEWAARQPWADGRVGMYGASYVGFTQWAAAALQPPALKTITPAFTFCDAYAMAHAGGAVTLGAAVSWALMAQAQMAIQRHPGGPQEKLALMGQLIALADGMARGDTFARLPLGDLPLIGRGGIAAGFADLLAHPVPDDLWRRLSCSYDRVAVPAFHVGGWYDVFTANTLCDYAGMRRDGGSELARAQQRLLIGPWTHASFEGDAGEVDFGLQASWMLVLPEDLLLRWFDHWLKGIDTGLLEEPPVRIFVMGDNRWRDEHEWPLARARGTRYYLHSGGSANSLHGDGALSLAAPGEQPADTFVYDPRNPAPTRGGALCCWRAALPSGPYDQREVEARPDVLVYTTPPLEHDLEVTGPIAVHLWAATSAPDTDFTAKLVDVEPSGCARNLQDGIVRARYRAGFDRPRPLAPGEVYEYVIDLAATSNVFQGGHRIRVEISSSNFPRFDRNLNTGEALAEAAALQAATQTVLHDAAHPSYILLPVIPR